MMVMRQQHSSIMLFAKICGRVGTLPQYSRLATLTYRGVDWCGIRLIAPSVPQAPKGQLYSQRGVPGVFKHVWVIELTPNSIMQRAGVPMIYVSASNPQLPWWILVQNKRVYTWFTNQMVINHVYLIYTRYMTFIQVDIPVICLVNDIYICILFIYVFNIPGCWCWVGGQGPIQANPPAITSPGLDMMVTFFTSAWYIWIYHVCCISGIYLVYTRHILFLSVFTRDTRARRHRSCHLPARAGTQVVVTARASSSGLALTLLLPVSGPARGLCQGLLNCCCQ